MRTKLLCVMLVLGLVAVGFSVFGLGFAVAGVAHVVDGEVGPSNAAGAANPANEASAVLYLVNKPAEPIQTQAQVQAADGTNYASFGVDVGSPWNWAAGDTVVAVVETVAGTNGWTGANQTASSNMALTIANIDSLPRANLEAIPSLTLVRAATYVDVQWTALAASNTDVKNYTVSRQTDGGGWVVLGRSGPHTSGAAMAYNDTTVTIGHRYCYDIAVNYRRDTGTALYTTTGTSNWACATIATAPVIIDTSPANGAIDVPVAARVFANFSLRMDPTTVTYTIAPNIGLTASWNVAGTSLALDHLAAFLQGTLYTVRITNGQDMVNHMPLAAGPVPNPWSFTTYSPSAQISNTTPWNLQRGVALTAPIVVSFSKSMTPGNVGVTFAPNPGGVTMTWNVPTNTIMTVTHTAFAANTQYQVTVTDPSLVNGPVPNPWTFTTNAPPTGAVTAPVATSDWSGASSQTIAWTMADDVPLNVEVWINYTAGGAPVPIAGMTPYTASSATHTWNPVPSIDSTNVIVTIDVVDAAGGKVTLSSLPFTIDSTVPTATTSPTSGATAVGITDDVVITFSEKMAQTPTQGNVSILPDVTGKAFSWDATGMILTMTHNPFAIRTAYTLTIAVGAHDLSTPGNPIALTTVPFTTGSPVPSAPTLTVADATLSDVQAVLTWTAPTTFVGLPGWVLQAGNITGYLVFRAPTCSTPQTSWTNITPTSGVTGLTFTATSLTAATPYCFFVQAVTTNGLSAMSAGVSVTTKQTVAGGDLTWLYILLIIIIVVVVIALILWSRRKKPEAVAPEAAPAAPEEPAPEAAPAEESTPPEEGGSAGGETGGQTGGEGGTPPA